MSALNFRTPPTILVENGGAGKLASIDAFDWGKRILLVTDETLVRLGITAPIKAALEKFGKEVIMFSAVEPEPSVAAALACVQAGAGADSVLGLGGGSPMDIAKLAALVLGTPQDIEGLYGVGKAVGRRLPLALAPTTAGTGSEATQVAVVTSRDGAKSPIVAPQLLADLVLLDASLTYGLPPAVTAATGIDAMVHAIEAYTSGLRKNPAADMVAMKALHLLHGSIRTCYANGSDAAARQDMLVGAMLAGLAFANASVGAVHALAYPIGADFHVAHGVSNAVMLAAVMRFNASHAEPYYAEIARALLPGARPDGDSAACEKLIDEMTALVRELGLPARLADLDIGARDLDTLTDGALRQDRLLSYNIRPMDRTDISAIYKSLL